MRRQRMYVLARPWPPIECGGPTRSSSAPPSCGAASVAVAVTVGWVLGVGMGATAALVLMQGGTVWA